jgi:hypothetical protein
MRTKIGALAAVAGLTLALGVTAARAGIVETIIDTDTAATLGRIIFPAFSGTSDDGVLFSYGEFTQANITSISWTLDLTTGAVDALNLNALRGDNPCPNGNEDCSNMTVNLSPTLATSGGASCSFSGNEGLCFESFGLAAIHFVPVVVPEPSTWAMMVVGFVGLGLAGRRPKRQAAAQGRLMASLRL